LRDPSRYKIPVRATRAYLAGFGTSGSLLAGAAVLFVLGSAIVAFRGWPQIATGPATTAVAASPAGVPSHAGARLAAVLAGRAVATAPHGAATANRRRRSAVRGVFIRAPHTAPINAASGSGIGVVGSPCAAGCTGPGSQNPITNLTNTVAQNVSNVGATVGSGIGSASGTVAGKVGGVSPQGASAIQGAGTSAGGTVSGTASTTASVIAQVGTTAGGGH
jgi:hypothetical protein